MAAEQAELDLYCLVSQVEEARKKSKRLFKKCQKTQRDLQIETLEYLKACNREEKQLVRETFHVVVESMKNEIDSCSSSLAAKDRATKEQAGQLLRGLLADWKEVPVRTSRIQSALLSKWRKVLQVIEDKRVAPRVSGQSFRPN